MTGAANAVAQPPVPPANDGAFALTADETQLLAARLQGARRPRVSLAMSGGGVRSSLFNIGVLKALYDQGVLDRVDLVSSVSGGSYTSYWLYTNALASPSGRFGARALDDRHFPQRICEIVSEGNFVRLPTMLVHLFTGFPRARAMYQRALVRTYGDQDPGDDPIDMDDLAPLVAAGAPYLIVNASTRGRGEDALPWARRLFEFTPLHYGNAERGYSAWRDRDHPLQTAAVTSGAALAVLNRRFDAPFPGSGAGDYVKLYDGGKTENLGAIAPLLRGTQQLIVVDAQLDDDDRPFGAYFRLKQNLAPAGVTLQVEAIERAPDQPAARFSGVARSAAVTTRVDYIKMRMPDALRTAIAAAPEAVAVDGEALRQRIYGALDASKVDGRWNCEAVRGIAGDYRNWLFYETAEYLRWSEGRRGPYRTLTRSLGRLAAFRQDFPEHTTVDQSFYLDQAIAYIGLGYWIAMQPPQAVDGGAEQMPPGDGAGRAAVSPRR